ncbi:MAG: hypothetical protein QW478_04545 [Candidatus Micrarchaeaceae archaeon]
MCGKYERISKNFKEAMELRPEPIETRSIEIEGLNSIFKARIYHTRAKNTLMMLKKMADSFNFFAIWLSTYLLGYLWYDLVHFQKEIIPLKL